MAAEPDVRTCLGRGAEQGLAVSEVEQRIEELCLAFESTKSYFVSRWRWPDRFNP